MCVCYIHLCRYLKQRKASDPIFVSFTEQRRGAERHTLESLLRLPISRIWEYDKLIWQLMAVTSECHPDFPNLKEVSVKLHAVCLLQHSSGVHCSFVWPVSCSFIQMVQCREDAIKFAENEVYSLAELMDFLGRSCHCLLLRSVHGLCLPVYICRTSSFKYSHAFHTTPFVSTSQWIYCM